jgi:hypothetical protein
MRLMLSVLSLSVAVASLSAQQGQFVGRWNLQGTGPDADKFYWLEVTEKDGQLSGQFLNRTSHATPVAWIKVENGELSFQYGGRGEGTPQSPVLQCGPIFRARLQGDKLVGSHSLPGVPCPSGRGGRGGANANAAAAPVPAPAPPPTTTINWVGARQPVWPHANANGVHTYGKPVVLAGPGVGVDVWGGARPGQEGGWKVVDGVFTNEPPTFNPVSKERFKDFRLDAEFMLPAQNSNSGLYIRGRYELQLSQAGMGGATNGRQSLGAIYGFKAPDYVAGKPVGEWQTLEAVVVGNRINVWLNGVKIHNNAELTAMTGGGLDNNELEPGPIMIQGDHQKVSFRKLVVTPITKPGH